MPGSVCEVNDVPQKTNVRCLVMAALVCWNMSASWKLTAAASMQYTWRGGRRTSLLDT